MAASQDIQVDGEDGVVRWEFPSPMVIDEADENGRS